MISSATGKCRPRHFLTLFPPFFRLLILIATLSQATKTAMSRLIIKNLPPYLTPDTLRKHFTGQASKNVASTSSSPKTFTLTDAKIAYKPDGTSRRFGFVGFKTEKEAEEAKRWFDKSFIDSMRINVEVIDVSPLRFYSKRLRLGCLSFTNSLLLGNQGQRRAASETQKARKRFLPFH